MRFTYTIIGLVGVCFTSNAYAFVWWAGNFCMPAAAQFTTADGLKKDLIADYNGACDAKAVPSGGSAYALNCTRNGGKTFFYAIGDTKEACAVALKSKPTSPAATASAKSVSKDACSEKAVAIYGNVEITQKLGEHEYFASGVVTNTGEVGGVAYDKQIFHNVILRAAPTKGFDTIPAYKFYKIVAGRFDIVEKTEQTMNDGFKAPVLVMTECGASERGASKKSKPTATKANTAEEKARKAEERKAEQAKQLAERERRQAVKEACTEEVKSDPSARADNAAALFRECYDNKLKSDDSAGPGVNVDKAH